jgi:hypothetical protein
MEIDLETKTVFQGRDRNGLFAILGGKMSSEKARVFLRKEAAAQRQLDAAIRMTLAEEDELAIHTVLAAAYGILRDLKQKSKERSELRDRLGLGIFGAANDLASGKTLPPVLAQSNVLADLITRVSDAIKRGEVSNEQDVIQKMRVTDEKGFWNKFNRSANFLKHADRDPGDSLAIDEVSNEVLFASAISAYCEIMGGPTGEMIVYAVFQGYYHIDNLSPRLRAIAEQPVPKRRRSCQSLLRELRTRGAAALE